MECKCIKEYQDIKVGMKFDVIEIYVDYYVLQSNVGWTIEVSNKYYEKCFKQLD